MVTGLLLIIANRDNSLSTLSILYKLCAQIFHYLLYKLLLCIYVLITTLFLLMLYHYASPTSLLFIIVIKT